MREVLRETGDMGLGEPLIWLEVAHKLSMDESAEICD